MRGRLSSRHGGWLDSSHAVRHPAWRSPAAPAWGTLAAAPGVARSHPWQPYAAVESIVWRAISITTGNGWWVRG